MPGFAALGSRAGPVRRKPGLSREAHWWQPGGAVRLRAAPRPALPPSRPRLGVRSRLEREAAEGLGRGQHASPCAPWRVFILTLALCDLW